VKPAVFDIGIQLSTLVPKLRDDTTSDNKLGEEYNPPNSKIQEIFKYAQNVYFKNIWMRGIMWNQKDVPSGLVDCEQNDSSEETEYCIRDSLQRIIAPHITIATPSIFGLRHEYIQYDLWEISVFLTQHTFLISLLNEAFTEIQAHFPSSKVYLKISRDHESTKSYEELVALIETDLSVDEAIKQLDEFDENWWDNNIDLAQDLLVIRI
jgi:hypothetical protein